MTAELKQAIVSIVVLVILELARRLSESMKRSANVDVFNKGLVALERITRTCVAAHEQQHMRRLRKSGTVTEADKVAAKRAVTTCVEDVGAHVVEMLVASGTPEAVVKGHIAEMVEATVLASKINKSAAMPSDRQ